MSNVIKSVATELTNSNKRIIIPAGSILSTINPVNVLNNGTMDGLDVKLANILSNELNHIRNNILPLIKEYGKFVNDSINSRLASSPLQDVRIYSIEIPEVIAEMVNRKIININGDANRRINDKALVLNKPEISKIREYLNYNASGQMENIIKNFVNNISDNELSRIWDTYLTNISAMNTNYISLGYRVNGEIFGLDLFVLSILVKSLLKVAPDTRVSVSVYNDTMLTLDAVLDNKIAMILRLIDSSTRLGKLIYKGESINEVIVFKEVYNKFLNDGGSPEAIYGAVLNKVGAAHAAVVLGDLDKNNETWDKFIKNESIKQKLGTLEQHRIAYRLGVTELYNNFMDEELKATIPAEINNNINDVIINFLNSKKAEKLFNINHIVEDFITEVLFAHTNAKEFISYMKHYSRLDPNLSAKEAATYASADLVIDFLLANVEIR